MGTVSVKKQINQSKDELKSVMMAHLAEITESLVEQIMANYRKLIPSQRGNAIKDLTQSGVAVYKKELLSAVAIVADLALQGARKEVPKKSKIELTEWDASLISLGEFEKLPAKMQKRLKNQVDLLIKTQKNDLDKVVMFQFTSSNESTDSESTIRYDLYESADKYLNGPSVDAGAGVMAARTVNESRQAFFFDDEVLEGIDAFKFVNDVPETPICEDLNGTIFSADDPDFQRYTPPLHYNCDSYIIPILKGNLGDREIERLKPSSSDLDKYIQFNEHHQFCCGPLRLVDLQL